MFCKNCGKELSSNEKYCSNCGKSVMPIQNSNINSKKTKKKSSVGKTIGIIIGSIVFAFIFIILLMSFIIGSMTSNVNQRNIDSNNIKKNDSSSTNSIITTEDIVTGKDWEFKIKDVTFGQRINPPNTSGFYSYYQVKNTDNTYLCITLDVKNLSELDLKASNFATITVKYDNKYTYSSFSAIPDSITGFTYTDITNIKPLTSNTLYFLSEMPKNISDETDTPMHIEIKCENKTYIYNYR